MSAQTQALPELTSAYPISRQNTLDYLRNGHLLLRGVASAEEVESYRQAIKDTAGRHNKETKPLEKRDTYHKAFLQTGNIWENDETVKRFVFAKRFARIAAEIMDVEGVRLYHDQALFKEPGGGHTPWHIDQYYWPLDTDKCVTMWMPLVDCPAEMGTIIFATGSHLVRDFPQMHISDTSEAFFNEESIRRDFPLAIGEMRAGDATFHNGWTLHKAPGNSSSRLREAMTIIYFADGVKVHEPRNQHQPADLARFLDNKPAGSLADGPLNPLLWHRSWEE